ncbi:hypothetical protein PSI9734_01480 [Pseudidiomarina piscicola]|uniref:Flagellar hook-length control protein-like C-terminal domain-containing protein n=1 Tax=Pseudidiomarina piscicola TaxID=2614830 RepID=A0A6S6WMM5_9GAMM|nr:flagellar hook-length control protein FliK [Pseudidiomarina piscicola]CAB0151064.1 hypothetical protein PSI9734_01480 [Pseudidiomarina piscicola]VZT40573.1 hypothetical protein PSI9734_01480 [Pseudomonas aeruginosa]
MSSITPLLDTLVHQVAAQKGTVPLNSRGAAPVAPIQAAGSATQFSQAGQQLARLVQLVTSFQAELSSQSAAPRPGGVREAPFFSQRESIQIDALIKHLHGKTQLSGLFYEHALKRWTELQLPFSRIQQQPQNSASHLRNVLAKQQLEMVSSGLFRFEFNVSPELQLFGVVQPDIHPLVRRWRDQRSPSGEHEFDDGWTSEIELKMQTLGRLRARIRMQSERLHLELQTQDQWHALLEAAAPKLREGLFQRHQITLESLVVRGGL